MKSFKEFLGEQGEEGRKEFRDLLKSKNIDIRIQQQPSSQPSQPPQPSYQGKAAKRAAKIAIKQASIPNPERISRAALSPREQQAQIKGYRTPEGNITQRGIETYATRRGSLGYGDPGKDPSKYGVDPRNAANAARERTRIASQGVGSERRAARRSIKIDIAKIEKNYPAPSSAPKTTFSDFSKRASEITGDVKSGRSRISQPSTSTKKDERFFRSLDPNPEARTRAKIDASLGQTSDALRGISGPQVKSGYSSRGLSSLQRAVQNVSDEPQLPNLPKPAPAPAWEKPKPAPKPAWEAPKPAPASKPTPAVAQKPAPKPTPAVAPKPAQKPAPAPETRMVTGRIGQSRTYRGQSATGGKPDMATQISTAAGNVMRGVESDKMKSLQKTTTNISKPLLRATQTVSALNTYNYGRTQQGDKPSTAAVRAATVPVVSGALAAKVGKELIKRRLPKWAIPAAAATYGAAEPALNYTFNKVKEFMRGGSR